MAWSVQHDRDAFKEVWLLLTGSSGHFPLYSGQSAWIEYTYTVPVTKWGNWFRRAVRLPTRHLSVVLDFPTALGPTVWGLHTSLTAESLPFPTPHPGPARRRPHAVFLVHPRPAVPRPLQAGMALPRRSAHRPGQ